MPNLWKDQPRHCQFDGGLRAWQREYQLAADDPAAGSAEHGAAANFLEAEETKELTEAGERLLEALLDDVDGAVAAANSGAAGGDDRVDVIALQHGVKQSGQYRGLIANDLLSGDDVSGLLNELANPMTTLIGFGRAGVAQCDDSEVGDDRCRLPSVLLVSHAKFIEARRGLPALPETGRCQRSR